MEAFSVALSLRVALVDVMVTVSSVPLRLKVTSPWAAMFRAIRWVLVGLPETSTSRTRDLLEEL
jgi:hypothetical protein